MCTYDMPDEMYMSSYGIWRERETWSDATESRLEAACDPNTSHVGRGHVNKHVCVLEAPQTCVCN
jgi:hypothetical protein